MTYTVKRVRARRDSDMAGKILLAFPFVSDCILVTVQLMYSSNLDGSLNILTSSGAGISGSIRALREQTANIHGSMNLRELGKKTRRPVLSQQDRSN